MSRATASGVMADDADEGKPWREQMREKLRIKNRIVVECLAEFIGTLVLLVFGYGCVAQAVFNKTNPLLAQSGLQWGWAVGVAMGVWISAGVSGGHINPAVTLTMAVLGRVEWRKVPAYWLSQYAAGFVAAFMIYVIYQDALDNFDGGTRIILDHGSATAHIWATYPPAHITISTGIIDQIVGTAILVLCACAVTDPNNSPPPGGLAPLTVGLVVLGIGVSMGSNCGYPINPARDFPARLFTAAAGWGFSVFTVRNNWSWVPVIMPHVGALIGGLVYHLLIGLHLDQPNSDDAIQPRSSRDQQNERGEDPGGIINVEYTGDEPYENSPTFQRKFHGVSESFSESYYPGKSPCGYDHPPPIEYKMVEYSHRF